MIIKSSGGGGVSGMIFFSKSIDASEKDDDEDPDDGVETRDELFEFSVEDDTPDGSITDVDDEDGISGV